MSNRLLTRFIALACGGIVGYACVSFFQSHDISPEGLASAPQKRSLAPLPSNATVHPSIDPPDASPPLLTAANFHQRLAEIRSIESSRKRAWKQEEMFLSLTPEEATKIFSMYQENPDGFPFGDFFKSWGAVDGPSALLAANTLEERLGDQAAKELLKGWAKADLRGAWKAALPYLDSSDKQKNRLGRGVLKEMIAQDPDGVIQLVESDLYHSLNNTLRAEMTQHALEKGSTRELMQHIATLSNQDERSRWYNSLFSRWATQDADASLDALSQIPNPTDATEATSAYLRGWAMKSPSEALDYAMDNHSQPAVAKVLPSIVSQYLRNNDSADLDAVLQKVTSNGLVDQIGPNLVYAIASKDPVKAVAFANQFQDPEVQKSAQNHIAGNWAIRDYQGALDYYRTVESTETRQSAFSVFALGAAFQPDNVNALTEALTLVPPSPQKAEIVASMITNSPLQVPRNREAFLKALKDAAQDDPFLAPSAKEALQKPPYTTAE